VAVLSALQTGTEQWAVVFGAAAVIALVAFVYAWRYVDRSVPQPAEPAVAPSG
jgi:hypothetical protein